MARVKRKPAAKKKAAAAAGAKKTDQPDVLDVTNDLGNLFGLIHKYVPLNDMSREVVGAAFGRVHAAVNSPKGYAK